MEPDRSKHRYGSASARSLMLVGALVLVAVVNVIASISGYLVVGTGLADVSSAEDELPLTAPVTRANATLSSDPPPVASVPTPAASHHQDCKRLHASHVEAAFYNSSDCYTRAQVVTILKQLVFTAVNAFTAHNVTYFLDSGTLLGAFRAQRVIAHDNDADIGIDSAALQYLQHHAVEFPSQYAFTVWNSTLYPNSPRDDKLPARLIHRSSGLYLDIFAFLDWTDHVDGTAAVGPLSSWCFMNCASCPTAATGGRTLRVPREWIYPLVDCEFEGATLKCPQQTPSYLKYTFGSNYMIPIKYRYSG